MAQATVSFSLGNYPDGVDQTFEKVHIYGTITVVSPSNAYTYVTNGLPITFLSAQILVATPQPFWGEVESFTSLLTYRFDPTHQTIRIYASGTEVANGAAVTADTALAHFVINRESSPTG